VHRHDLRDVLRLLWRRPGEALQGLLGNEATLFLRQLRQAAAGANAGDQPEGDPVMKPDCTIYFGERLLRDASDPHSISEVIVMCDGERLSPRASLAVRNHSPDGFNWGYGGSGPAQLALGLMLDFLDDEPHAREIAQHHYQQFKWDVIARLPGDQGWQLNGLQIRQAIEAMEHRRPFTPAGDISEHST
jgi:hypothetical protein